MATILYLRLDANGDPVFDPNVALADADAVRQAIQTRLLLFEGEWFEDLNEGTPLFQQILGVIKKAGNQDVASLAITARIAGSPFVTGVSDISSSVDEKRKLTYSATAQTIFGPVPVTFTPGSAASLGA